MHSYCLTETSNYDNCFSDQNNQVDDYGGTTISQEGRVFNISSPLTYFEDNSYNYSYRSCSEEHNKRKEKGNEKSSSPKVLVKQPGETKNLPKCYARLMNSHISNILKNTSDEDLIELLSSHEVEKFQQLKPDSIGKSKIDEFMNTEVGQLIAPDFFGNCRWMYGLVKENKANIDPYLRHNISYYEEALRCKKRKLN